MRRTKPEMVADILERINNENSKGKKSKKTNIMYGCGLTLKDANKYLDFLVKNELLINDDQKSSERGYSITLKGQDYMVKIKSAVEIIKSLEGL